MVYGDVQLFSPSCHARRPLPTLTRPKFWYKRLPTTTNTHLHIDRLYCHNQRNSHTQGGWVCTATPFRREVGLPHELNHEFIYRYVLPFRSLVHRLSLFALRCLHTHPLRPRRCVNQSPLLRLRLPLSLLGTSPHLCLATQAGNPRLQRQLYGILPMAHQSWCRRPRQLRQRACLSYQE
jgi:hypothetical protein